MEDLFNDDLILEDLDLEDKEYDEDDKFKTALFGFNKRSVMNHISSLEDTIDQMQKNLEGQIKELIHEKEGLSQEKNYLEQEYTLAKHQKEKIEEELQELDQEYQKVMIVLEQLEEFETINKSLNLKNTDLEEENNKLLSKIKELNEVFEMAKKQEHAYAQKMDLLRDTLNDQKSLMEDIEKKNELMKSELDGYEKEIAKLNKKYEEALQAKEQLQDDLKEKLTEIEAMTEVLESQKVEISKLNEEKEEFLRFQTVQTNDEPAIMLGEPEVQTLEETDEFEEFLEDLKFDVKQIQHQLQEIHYQTIETQRINQQNFDQALLPLIKKIEFLETSNRKTTQEREYSRFSKPKTEYNTDSLYRQYDANESPRMSDYEKKINALEQQKQVYSNELEQKIIEMYQRLAKNS